MLPLRLTVQLIAMMMLVDFYWLSNLWLVLPAAHTALDADQMARFEGWIAPQAWHQQRQQRQADPALGAAHLIRRTAAARARMVDEIAL